MNLFATFAFLTRLPVPRRLAGGMWSARFFPLVGAVIGSLLAGLASVTGLNSFELPVGVRAWLVTAASFLLTGGLHLDGLMDAADGLLSGKSPERSLDIMRDSRLGGMGAVAGIVLVLGKWTISGALLEAGAYGPFIFTPLWARWGAALAVQCFPYVREQGLASAYFAKATHSRHRDAVVASVTALLITVLVAWLDGSSFGLVLGPPLVCSVTTLFLGKRWISRFGGLTGDLYGAVIELNELLALLASVILLSFAR